MTLTLSKNIKRDVPGSRYETVTVVACDASYPNTGTTVGYPLTPNLLQLQQRISDAYVVDQIDTGGIGYFAWIDPTTGNLRVASNLTDAEVTNGTSLAGILFKILARGV